MSPNRQERRALESVDRRAKRNPVPVSAPETAEHNVLCVIVSYRGLDGLTSENLEHIKDAMFTAGHGFAHKTIRRTPLDLARNESFTLVRTTEATSALLLDDDCQIDPLWLPRALSLLDAGLDVVTAPVRLRGEEIVFNIDPVGLPVSIAGERVMQVRWTGFGCVLMKRSVIETMHEKLPSLHYESQRYEKMMSCAVFQSAIVPNKLLGVGGDPATRRYVLDDRIWSLRAAALGIKVHATIDVDTCHDGFAGNFGQMFDRCIICTGCREEMVLQEFPSLVAIPDEANLQCFKCGATANLLNTHRPIEP